MSEDLAFKIQLGLVLPQMEAKLSSELSTIVESLVTTLKAGTEEGEALDMGSVKELIMKDFDIFITNSIIPPIEKKFAPPAQEASEPAETEESPE